jgi:hypothetical protein
MAEAVSNKSCSRFETEVTVSFINSSRLRSAKSSVEVSAVFAGTATALRTTLNKRPAEQGVNLLDENGVSLMRRSRGLRAHSSYAPYLLWANGINP